MRVEVRKKANGGEYFSFVYWDGDKRVRLKKGEYPNFESLEKAQQWARTKEAEVDCAKSRARKRLEWRNLYYDFSKIADEYIDYCKRTQVNSWSCTTFYFEHYVLPFFLEVKAANNPNNWSMYFEDYKDWLEKDAYTIRDPEKLISYSSKNHCIKTLNTFLTFLVRKNLIDHGNVYKVTGFPTSKINARDASSVLSKEEFESVHQILKELNPLIATFFQTAYYTGMRFNEIFGLSIDDLFNGELEECVLKKSLENHKMDYWGYVVLESQPEGKTRARLPNKTIKRKPLKGKPQINEKFNRIIPIINKDLFNNLVALYKVQREKFKNNIYGSNPKDYVLFEEMTMTDAAVILREAYARTKYTPKSYHCCRHTRCTELVGQTGDFIMAKAWLGHARQETTLRYTHIHQQMTRSAKKKTQAIEFVD
jgi:integrase